MGSVDATSVPCHPRSALNSPNWLGNYNNEFLKPIFNGSQSNGVLHRVNSYLCSREGLRVCLQDLSIGHLRLAVNTGGLEALQVLHADAVGDAGDAAGAAKRNPSPNP